MLEHVSIHPQACTVLSVSRYLYDARWVTLAVPDLLIALGFSQRTVYEDLDDSNTSTWRTYFELVPSSWQLTYTRTKLDHFKVYDSFAADVAAGDLASYSTSPRHGLCVCVCVRERERERE